MEFAFFAYVRDRCPKRQWCAQETNIAIYLFARLTKETQLAFLPFYSMEKPVAHREIVGGASLILAFNLSSKVVFVVGGGTHAANRVFAILQADAARVFVLVPGGLQSCCEELQWRSAENQIQVVDIQEGEEVSTGVVVDELLLQVKKPSLSFAFVTDTVIGDPHRRSLHSASILCVVFRKRNIPVNVTDFPTLCDFTIPATHRYVHSQTGVPTGLQISVATNGKGCRLGGRIRREIVSRLPKEVGAAVETIGRLRSRAKSLAESSVTEEILDADDDASPATPNAPVPQFTPQTKEDSAERSKRRMRWIAQISEFWPFDKLASFSETEQQSLLTSEFPITPKADVVQGPPQTNSLHNLDIRPPGKIYLLGSGPGHPSLLTIAAHEILTRKATVVLSDKLVPEAVLAMIPKTTTVKIAKKFPGNADGAQNELMLEAVEAAKRGEIVARVCIMCHLELQIELTGALAKARGSKRLWPSRRRNSSFPETRLRVYCSSRYLIRTLGSNL